MRIALFTLESLASAEAVHAFVAQNPGRIVLLGHSDPHRAVTGGLWGQLRRHLQRSGQHFLPYLAANFAAAGLLRRRGRLSDLCRSHAIPALKVSDVNGAATRAALRAARPDVILSFHFDQIFAAETLELAPLRGINVHPSLLPRHRGPIPTLYALAEKVTGVSVHVIAPRIDAGDVLAQQALALAPGITASGAAQALHLAALPLVERALAMLTAPPLVPPLGPPLAPSLALPLALPLAPSLLPPLPYCPFPDAAALRRFRAQGVRLVSWKDARAALLAPVGGW